RQKRHPLPEKGIKKYEKYLAKQITKYDASEMDEESFKWQWATPTSKEALTNETRHQRRKKSQMLRQQQ
ncbi:21993_t:CDS:2, partial [Gigaspora margarita]